MGGGSGVESAGASGAVSIVESVFTGGRLGSAMKQPMIVAGWTRSRRSRPAQPMTMPIQVAMATMSRFQVASTGMTTV